MPPRRDKRGPVEWDSAAHVPPPPGAKPRECPVCKAAGQRVVYLDYPAGRWAHEQVIGHYPEAPAPPQKEAPQ